MPEFTSTPTTSVSVDSPYAYNITTAINNVVDLLDSNGEVILDSSGSAIQVVPYLESAVTTLTVTVLAAPDWLVLSGVTDSGTALLAGTPNPWNAGSVEVSLRVTNNLGYYADQTYQINVASITNEGKFYDYSGLAATAKRLISKFGRTVQILAKGSTGEAWNPAVSWNSFDVRAVNIKLNQAEVDGTLILATDTVFLVEATSGLNLESRIKDGDDVYSVVQLTPLKPGNTLMFYRLIARK